MAGAVEERKRCGIAGRWADRGAAGQKPGSAAGARWGGAAEARARPNVEVNRRAEGTSELNRRLGVVGQGAAALECCGAAGDHGWGLAGRQAQCACFVLRRSSSRPATGQRLPVAGQLEAGVGPHWRDGGNLGWEAHCRARLPKRVVASAAALGQARCPSADTGYLHC